MPVKIPERDPCPFCRVLSGEYPCAFVYRGRTIASFIEPRQYGKGGILVIPIRHAPTILDLSDDEIQQIYVHAKRIVNAISRAFDPIGFNIFQNNGVAAGQTVPYFQPLCSSRKRVAG